MNANIVFTLEHSLSVISADIMTVSNIKHVTLAMQNTGNTTHQYDVIINV